MSNEWIKNIIEHLKPRLRNYGFWVGIVAQVTLLLTLIGFKIDSGWVMKVAQAILGILGIMGIINDPTTRNAWFSDDKKE